jgi:hypothetical protein
VTLRLKDGIDEQGQTFIDIQRLGKEVPAAKNKQVTIEILLGYNDEKGVFCWICPEAVHNEDS